MKKTTIAVLAIIIASFIVGIYLYPQMPEKMASHWNSKGEVDSYLPKFWGLSIMPIISAVLFLLFLAIPYIDPLKNNIKRFRVYYDWFVLIFIVLLFYVYTLTIFWNLDYRFNMTRMIIPALGMLFIYIGFLVENAKRNWFIGIRTPWTLSSTRVWNKTHKIGGKMFKAAGIIALFGVIFQDYAVWLVLVPVIFVVVYTIVYSYIEYQKESKKRK
jgi:uncharacterized membrane protein